MSTLNVYQSKYSSYCGDDLHALEHEQLCRDLHITSHEFTLPDYVLVGTADVTIKLMPRAEMIGTQIQSLRKQIEETRMEAGVKVLQLERQINSLLAIEGAATEVAT